MPAPETPPTLPLSLLVNPLARGAWFAAYLDVARAELAAQFGDRTTTVRAAGGLDFIDVDLPAGELPQLARLSWLQGAFERLPDDALRVVPIDTALALPAGLVDGAKYRGKTNEMMTRLAVEVGLRVSTVDPKHRPKLLDPMAGRGTTLLWAARLGIDARGIERDGAALDDLWRHVKRQTKLHRLSHTAERGFVGRKNRDGRGACVRFALGKGADARRVELIAGDSRDAVELLGGERFTAIVADLPYGVQHVGRGGTRDPLANLAACAPAWVECLRPGGAMVLVFNSLQPRRAPLVQLFEAQGLVALPWRAPHRMSESIVRDVAVFRRPRA